MNAGRSPATALRARTRGRARAPLVADIPRFRRLVLCVGTVIVIGIALTIAWATGSMQHAGQYIWQETVAASARQGLVVRYLVLNGRDRTRMDQIMALVAVRSGDPMLGLDLIAMRDRLQQNPWVQTARVERHWPDRITITLTERLPFAQWDNGSDTVLIDRTGHILTRQVPDDLSGRIILAARTLPPAFPDLVDAVTASPHLTGKRLTARWVAGRRWDLHIASGPMISLPQEGLADSLRHLETVIREHQDWEQALAVIDLRAASERIIIRPRNDTAPVAFDPDLTHKDFP